jgi:type III restriction enzyme
MALFPRFEGGWLITGNSMSGRRSGRWSPRDHKSCERTLRSHINFCVYDSTWEATEAFELDRNAEVAAWVRNDHLNFEILYIYRGVVHKYRPDFLVRLLSGEMMILEVKGEDTEQDQVKRRFLDEWVKAVNEHGGLGVWVWEVSRNPADIKDLLAKHTRPR